MRKPRIVFWDVETTPNLSYCFGLRDQNINHTWIKQESFMICASWRFHGEKRVHSVSVLDDPKRFERDHTDDLHVLNTILGVLDSCDASVAHFGDRFDWPYLRGRCYINGWDVPRPGVQIDTYKMANQLKLNSKRLDYLGQVTGIGRKLSTDPDWWIQCAEGKKSAIRKMVKYNKVDVELLQEVYYQLAPYAKPSQRLNFNTVADTERLCPNCGSDDIIKQGFKLTTTGKYQQYQCRQCGAWSSDSPRNRMLR